MVIENDLKIGLVGSIADEPIFLWLSSLWRGLCRKNSIHLPPKKNCSYAKIQFVKIANLEEFSEDKGWGFI